MSGGKELDVPAGRMAVPLMRHQRLALAWMLHRERTAANPRGGILADDQGLGKTVSTIALIVTNQRGDDVADEGFEDLAIDLEEDNVDAVAHPDAGGYNEPSAIGGASPASAIAIGHDVDSKVTPSTLTPSLFIMPVPTSDHASLACHQAATSVDKQATDSETQLAVPPQCLLSSANSASPASTQNGTFRSHKAAPGRHASPKQPSAEEEAGNLQGLPEGGTLIICPTAVLNQWSRELTSKVAPPAGKTQAWESMHVVALAVAPHIDACIDRSHWPRLHCVQHINQWTYCLKL